MAAGLEIRIVKGCNEMRIALDCDETLLETIPTLGDYYRASVDANANIPPHIWSSRWLVWGDDRNRWKEWFNTWINSEWYTKMPPFPGALAAVAKLKSDEHRLFVVSAGLRQPAAAKAQNQK